MAGDPGGRPTEKIGVVVERKHRVVQEDRILRIESSPRDARQQRVVKVDGHRSILAVGRWPHGPVRWPRRMVEMRGLEPLTPAMRTQCSPS